MLMERLIKCDDYWRKLTMLKKEYSSFTRCYILFSKSSIALNPCCSSNCLGFSTLNLETTYKNIEVSLGVAESQICGRHKVTASF